MAKLQVSPVGRVRTRLHVGTVCFVSFVNKKMLKMLSIMSGQPGAATRQMAAMA